MNDNTEQCRYIKTDESFLITIPLTGQFNGRGPPLIKKMLLLNLYQYPLPSMSVLKYR